MIKGVTGGQNPYVERLIGTVRGERVDRVLVFGEAHLRQILSAYAAYYNEVRTHLALGKDAPLGRAVQRTGVIVAIPILSGLHHHYGYNFRKAHVDARQRRPVYAVCVSLTALPGMTVDRSESIAVGMSRNGDHEFGLSFGSLMVRLRASDIGNWILMARGGTWRSVRCVPPPNDIRSRRSVLRSSRVRAIAAQKPRSIGSAPQA
jgi:integrase-like protein